MGVENPSVVEVGGLYGINVETLSGNKALAPRTDKMYQYLDPDGSDRTITMDVDSAIEGDRFIIRNTATYSSSSRLTIKRGVDADIFDYLFAGSIGKYVFNGTDWTAEDMGSGEEGDIKKNIAVGTQARAYSGGIAIGQGSRAYTSGVAIGALAYGYTSGVAIGNNADGINYGVSIGIDSQGKNYGVAVGHLAKTNNKIRSIALGCYSECERVGETSVNIDATSTQKNNAVQGRWAKTTTDATPVEMFCGGQPSERFLIRASSALAFRMTIVARDNVANEVAMYTVADGLIKRDGANNTTMVNCTVTTVHEDDAGWDVAVTADDTNEALIITVTGDAANPVQWAAVMDGVETHF